MNRADRDAWASARTLADLGELTAQWLEGGIASAPCYCARPDPETISLVPVLAQLNRARFVTIASQPGRSGPGYDGAHWRQRAAVEGFAGTGTGRLLVSVAGRAGMLVIVHNPSSLPRRRFRCDQEIPVTWRECEEYTWFGQQIPRREIRSRQVGWGICHRSVRDALCKAWQVALIDPEWGRPDLLWETLGQAVDALQGRAS